MTPTVNLLPARHAERLAERRWAGVVAAALLALLALVALASVLQGRALRQAEEGRDAEQAQHAALQARRREMAPFRQLSDALAGRERLLTAAMQTQVSWATVLTGLARTFPAESSLTSLTVESALPAFGPLPPGEPGDERSMIGTTTFKGHSVREFAPGVRRALQLLASVRGISEPRLQVGAADETKATRVISFEGSGFVDGSALTGRYAEGLPPPNDVDLPPIGGESARPVSSGDPPRPPR